MTNNEKGPVTLWIISLFISSCFMSTVEESVGPIKILVLPIHEENASYFLSLLTLTQVGGCTKYCKYCMHT